MSPNLSGEAAHADWSLDRLVRLAGLAAETRRRNEMAETAVPKFGGGAGVAQRALGDASTNTPTTEEVSK
jgi:hypothetical protein